MPEKSVKKVVIISDTHGFIHPEIAKLISQYDLLIHAGDVVSESIFDALDFSGKSIVIAGNNDEHIPHLNDIETLELFGEKIAIEHGHKHGHYQPSHASLRAAHQDAKIIIYGHTHIQVIDKSSKPWVINPGAAGKIRTNGGASCMILSAFADQEWQIECLRFE